MVLKFCGVSVRTDDEDRDAVSLGRQQRLQELLRGDSTHRTPAKFKKEVRVFFDSKRPHGLTFDGNHDDDDNAAQNRGYACRVATIDPNTGEVASYNARCRAIGDYAHVVTEGMRVRAVDDADLKGVAFDDVVKRVTTGCAGPAGCAVTFADVSSPPLSASAPPTLKAVGTVVLAAQRAKMTKMASPRSPTPGSPTASRARSIFNAHASPKVSKWSSVLTAVGESVKAAQAQSSQSQSDVLASDLAHKNAHLEAQLLIFKGRLAALEREKATLEQQWTEASERLERGQADYQELLTKLRDTEAQCTSATKRCNELEREAEALRAEAAALQANADALQHAHDGVLLQMQELQAEHCDVQHQAEELHARLVAAQLVKSELNERLTLLVHEQNQERAALQALQTELSASDAGAPATAIALAQQLLRSRNALHEQLEELQIELSCHETTIQHQQDARIELEDKLAALTQINESLRDQVRTLLAMPQAETAARPSETIAANETEANGSEIRELKQQLGVERAATARVQAALQSLEDKARAKLEQHAKEQLFLAQFKEQLVRGLAVTKYGARGSPHVRVLFSDAQCRWLSWRDPSDGASSPRADAKAEALDLVEVLLGARTEIFAQHKPPVPARCLSLVFCHPCRTLDIEVETRDRALFLRRGFRLLLEEVAEKRRRHEDEDAAVTH